MFLVVKRLLRNVYGSETLNFDDTFSSQWLNGSPQKKYLESLFPYNVNIEELIRISRIVLLTLPSARTRNKTKQ
jgi:hypothetical protein